MEIDPPDRRTPARDACAPQTAALKETDNEPCEFTEPPVDNDSSQVNQLRVETELPIAAEENVERLLPNLANERTDTELPMPTLFETESS